MYYLTIGVPVRASCRVDEQAVLSANCTACLPEMGVNRNGSAVQDGEQREADAHASHLATVKQVLRTTIEHLRRSDFVLAEIRNSIFTTTQIILNSQDLIRTSDLAIARMRTLDCE